jgi:hypothetical protein
MGAKPSSTNTTDQLKLWVKWVGALNDPKQRNKIKVGDLNPDMLLFVGSADAIANYQKLKPMPLNTLLYAAPPAQQDPRFLLGLVYTACCRPDLFVDRPGAGRKLLAFVTEELFTQSTFGEAFDKFQALMGTLKEVPLIYPSKWHYGVKDVLDRIYTRAAELAVIFQADQQASVLHASTDATLEGSCLRGLKDAATVAAEHCVEFKEITKGFKGGEWPSRYNETRWQYTIDPVHLATCGEALTHYFQSFDRIGDSIRDFLLAANFYSILENLIETGPLSQPKGGGGRLRPFLAKYDMLKFVTRSKPNNPRSQLIDTKDWVSHGSTVRNPIVLLAWLCLSQQCDSVDDTEQIATRISTVLQVASAPEEVYAHFVKTSTPAFQKALVAAPRWVVPLDGRAMMNVHKMWTLVESSMELLSPEMQADVARSEWKGIAHDAAVAAWNAAETKRKDLIMSKRHAFVTEQYTPMLQAWFALRDAALELPEKPAAAMPAALLTQLASSDFLLTSINSFAGILSNAAEKTLAAWAQMASSLRPCPTTAAGSVRALVQQRNPLLTLFMLCASSLEYDLPSDWDQKNVSLVALGEQIQDYFDQPSFADTVRYLQQIWRNLVKVQVVVAHKPPSGQYPNDYFDGWSDFLRLLQGVLTTLDIDLRACGPYPTVTDARPPFSSNSCRRWRNDVNECRKRSDKCDYVDYADNDDEVGIDTACNTREGWIDETMAGVYQWMCYGAQEPLVDVRAKLMTINLWEVFEAMCFDTRTVPSIVRSQLLDVLLLLTSGVTLDAKTSTICDDKAWVHDTKVRNPFVLACAATYSFLKAFPKAVSGDDTKRLLHVLLAPSWKEAAKHMVDPATLTTAFRSDQAAGVVSSWVKTMYLILSPENARVRKESTGFDPRVSTWQPLVDQWVWKHENDYRKRVNARLKKAYRNDSDDDSSDEDRAPSALASMISQHRQQRN